MTTHDIVDWPATRDVARQLEIGQVYVLRLVHAGRLRGVRTRLGWLVDPASVQAFAAERAERAARKWRGAP